MKARAICCGMLLLSAIAILDQTATAQSTQPGDLMAAYTALHTFTLDGGDAQEDQCPAYCPFHGSPVSLRDIQFALSRGDHHRGRGVSRDVHSGEEHVQDAM